MHELLRHQIRQFLGETTYIPDGLVPFLAEVSATYQQADNERAHIENSLDIASREMIEQHRVLAVELEVRRAAESQLEYLTNFDEVTKLVNRNLLTDRLQQALANAGRRSQKVAVLALGLDHFKLINDSLGHSIGNQVLKSVADRLNTCIRKGDTVARLADHEFALVLVEQRDDTPASGPVIFEAGLIPILQRILDTVSEPFALPNGDMNITCSIGVCLYPQDGDNVELLLRHADAAMISAMRLGLSNYQFYTADLGARIGERLALQSELRRALDRDEFVLHYQPQVDLHTGRIVAMEALIRWNHPAIGMVQPCRFIDVAEETGLIVPIGAWVIRAACMQCKAWQDSGYGNLRIAVNLSVRQFAQPDLVQFIADVLHDSGLAPNQLEIELTESLLMTDVERSIDILRGLHALGVRLAIDDFGTGYSSLSYLRRFPINALKIDQSFVHEIDTADAIAIVKAIISMAHSLGIQVIAEGVETETQCTFLSRNMCDEMQGFLFSKGLPAQETAALLHADRRLPTDLLRFHERRRSLQLVDAALHVPATQKRLLWHDN